MTHSTAIEHLRVYECQIRIRPSVAGIEASPHVIESLDGELMRLQALFLIDEENCRYPNEWAMGPLLDGLPAFVECGLSWIASGDVEVIREVQR